MQEADRYTLYGVGIGLFLALVGRLSLCFHQFGNFSFSSITSVQNEYFILWILDASPIWLGMLGRLAGMRQDDLLAQKGEFQHHIRECEKSEEIIGNRLGNILENTSSGIFICRLPDFKITQVSRGFIEQSGRSMTELKDMPVYNLFTDLDRKQFESLVTPLTKGAPGPINFSGSQVGRDGVPVPVEFQLTVDSPESPVFLTGIAQGFSSREIYREALAQEQKKFLDILENLPIAFHLQASDYSVPYGNKMFRERFGQPGEKPCYTLMHKREAPCEICQPFKVFTSNEESTSIWNAKDGKTYLTMCTPYTDIDQKPLIMEMALDISELEQAKKTAIEALDEAKKASATQSEFLTRMSHELRTPLHAILGFAQILEMDRGSMKPEHKRSFEHIINSGRHLMKLINDVLDLSNIHSGEIPLLLSTFSLESLISELLKLVQPMAQKKNISIEFVPEKDPILIQTDEMRLKQILLNLISNAIHYNKENGKVEIRLNRQGSKNIQMEIEDTGSGIPEDMLQKIFDPFHCWEDYSELQREGIGIGLSISERLVSTLGGTITATSQYNKGSCFSIILPTGKENRVSSSPDTIKTIGSPAPPGSGPLKVLYIEDNLANLDFFIHLFEARPEIEILSEVTGQRGIQSAINNLPDLIFLDIQLPDTSGLEVFESLRNQKNTSRIPIVFLTADAMPEQVEKAQELGAEGYITKPIKIQEFWEVFDKVLADSRKR